MRRSQSNRGLAHGRDQRLQRGQRGVSLFGLLFWAVVLAFGGVVVARVIPTVLEFYTIQRVVDRIAASNPSTVPAVRAAFETAQQVEYSMVSIRSQDLVVSKENDKLQISFAYDKQVDLAGPVYLLIKYEGKSR
ncbi:DUF4845 domain-containing protein [Paucibacter sp. DJ2R-2]|uniref:DUF4845 domain-containing protein n=1 Tax=Paucibacter sp. DJ2R-2 TaxID=2893558 RepID=UPI0021E471C0|nr:DUF4845 domain-containing protein [Paucibacter sp. DJ2R-2]MCV2423077.1 DUF4845 domain-containing protein [Paucibacter sp. DJ4R-1]MCV2440973.1 DUF4845 domain-containing protein [Paucibacter sp. DJ2R-2]